MDTRSTQTSEIWTPTAAEVAAIVAEMRPVIDRFAARDRRLLAECRQAA
jgi:hypothetical protein